MRWLALFLLFFLNVQSVYAVTIQLSQVPSVIGLEPFNLSTYIEGPSPGTNYLRVDLYKDSTTNYFGETYNGHDWYAGSLGLSYTPVVIGESGTASAQLTARLGTPTLTEYPGPGEYKLRIRRYTESGNPSSNDQQVPADISITFSWPTSTPPPTKSPTIAPTSTPQPCLSPTQIPTVIPTATNVTAFVAKISNSSTPTPKPSVSPAPSVSGQVAGVSIIPTPTIVANEKTKNMIIPVAVSLFFIAIGLALLAIVFIWKKKSELASIEDTKT